MVHLDPDGSVWTDLYSKPTDSHNYHRFESSHPRHCMQGLPYSQFLRVRWICSREEDFVRHCENLRTHFIRRGYPTRLLDSAITRAGDNHCKDLLSPHNETVTPTDYAERRLFAITTFHPTQSDFRTLIDNNWYMLGSPATQGLYESPVVFGHRRQKILEICLSKSRSSYLALYVTTQMHHYMSAISAGADTAPNWTTMETSHALWTVDTTAQGNSHNANLRI